MRWNTGDTMSVGRGGLLARIVLRYPVVGLVAVAASLSATKRLGVDRDLVMYHRWALGPFPSWDVPGPYPLGAGALWWPLRAVTEHGLGAFWILYCTLPATGLLAVQLWRSTRRPTLAVNVLLIGASLLGQTWWLRIEPVAACLGLLAINAARSGRPAVAGLSLSAGSLVKVWPAFLAPMALLLSRPSSWWRTAVGFALPWAAVAVAAAASHHPSAWTWLTFSATRRIQAESFTAWAFMWLSAVGNDAWQPVFRSGLDGALLLTGPHLRTTHRLLEAGSAAILAVTAWRVLRWLRRTATSDVTDQGRAARDLLHLAASAQVVVLGLLIIAGPVFSPQYLGWFAPVLTVAAGEGLLLVEAAVWIAACAATTLVYPFLYDHITDPAPLGMAALTVRDVLLLVLVASCAHRLWKLTADHDADAAPALVAAGRPAGP